MFTRVGSPGRRMVQVVAFPEPELVPPLSVSARAEEAGSTMTNVIEPTGGVWRLIQQLKPNLASNGYRLFMIDTVLWATVLNRCCSFLRARVLNYRTVLRDVWK